MTIINPEDLTAVALRVFAAPKRPHKAGQNFVYIGFDGINGSGKSTIIKALAKRWPKALLNREPGGSPGFGSAEIVNARQELRRLILSEISDPTTLAYLLAADRHLQTTAISKLGEMTKQVVGELSNQPGTQIQSRSDGATTDSHSPSLNTNNLSRQEDLYTDDQFLCSGNNVQLILQDRTFLSTLAFQGYGSEMDLQFLLKLTAISCPIKPDFIFLFDLPIEIAVARTRGRNAAEHDQFEHLDLAYHERVRQGFLQTAKECESSVIVVNATHPSDGVLSSVVKYLDVIITIAAKGR